MSASLAPPTLAPAERIGFLLLPRCSLMALGSALDALALANEASPRALYEIVLLSTDGAPVVSASGAAIAVGTSLAEAPELDALFVVSDSPLPHTGHDEVVAYLRRLDRATLTGGIGTGAWLLARAGLMNARRASVAPAYASLMQDSFDNVLVSSRAFECDGPRATCAGGRSAFDMFLHLIRRSHGEAIAQRVEREAAVPAEGEDATPELVPPKLAEALSLMRTNIREPLSTEDIARLAGVSRRQLARLFKQHLGTMPARHYAVMRLERARHLLERTRLPVIEVALSCGFATGPHFSSAYRTHFGLTPSEQRYPRAMHATPAGDAGASPCDIATSACGFGTFAREPSSREEAAWLT